MARNWYKLSTRVGAPLHGVRGCDEFFDFAGHSTFDAFPRATLVAEIGGFRRFANPRQLMAWLGLVPRERSSGASTSRGAITKAGNGRARRLLIESAWTYRLPARIASQLLARSAALPEAVKAVAWKAQVRLCARYRRLRCSGKPTNVVTVAIARELAAFAWAIAIIVMPAPQTT